MTEPTPPTLAPFPDAQDPLPESNWFWRRVFVFLVTAAILWMVWGAITRLGAVAVVVPDQGIPALLSLCRWLLLITAMMVTYYMVAPSAEQTIKMMQTAKLLTGGVKFATSSATTETPAATTTTTATTAGLPPAEPIPAPLPVPATGANAEADDVVIPESLDDLHDEPEPDLEDYRPAMPEPTEEKA